MNKFMFLDELVETKQCVHDNQMLLKVKFLEVVKHVIQ